MKRKRIIYGSTIIALILLIYSLGFRIVYNPKLENSWDAISAIGEWIGVIATIVIAINLKRQNSMISPTVKFVNFSLLEEIPYLVVTNTGERPLIISQVSFNCGQYSLGRINAEDYSDIGSVTTDHYIVKPFNVVKIYLPVALFQSQIAEFHNGDANLWARFEKEIENENMEISFKDISGKYYREKTSLNAIEYLNIVLQR